MMRVSLQIVFAALFLALFAAGSSSVEASSIYQMHMPDEKAAHLTYLAGNQYVICDDCPALSQLTEIIEPLPVRVPLAVTFEKDPLPLNFPEEPSATKLPLLTVHFDLNSSRLKGGEKHKIRESSNSLKGNIPLKIIGYTCELGGQRHNDRLALRRAHAVQNVLVGYGFKRGDLTVEGKGKCCYSSPDIRHSENRRVEIITIK